MRRAVVVLLCIFLLLSGQVSPVLAQMQVPVPTHTVLPQPLPVHHQIWQALPVPVQQHMLQPPMQALPVHHHLLQPLPLPVHQHLLQVPTQASTLPVHHNIDIQGLAGGSSAPVHNVNMDLSSTVSSLSAGHLLHNGSITIDAGGALLNVTAGTRLTPAEYLAVQEVVRSGQQTIILDAQGRATGGSFVVSPHLSQMLSNLVIPRGVTAIDFSRSGTLNLAGNLIDNGKLYISTFNPGQSTVKVEAGNITVQGQGLISDILPAGNLYGSAGVSPGLGLSLTAAGAINNAGTISSGGSLHLAAGAMISNSGLISSSNGSINIAATNPAGNININGNGGTFQALNGAINVRDASYAGAANININGGNYLSTSMNLYSGTGTVLVAAGQLTGQLNIEAGTAHVAADTSVLTLGSNNITGDPTYYSTGNIDINGVVSSSGADLAIIAGGSITATSSSAQITTSGGNLLMIAGATIAPCSSCSSSGVLPGSANPATGNITVNLTTPSATGGNIDLSASSAGSGSGYIIDTTGPSIGNVSLIALAATPGASGSGYVNLQGVSGTIANSIKAELNNVGGYVSIVAGGTNSASGNAIAFGNIQAFSVAMVATQASGILTVNSSGDITGGGVSYGPILNIPVSGVAGASQSTITATGGSVDIHAGAVSIGSIDTNFPFNEIGNVVTILAQGNLSFANITAPSAPTFLQSNGSISFSGSINTSATNGADAGGVGGGVFVVAAGGVNSGGAGSSSINTESNRGGLVIVSAGSGPVNISSIDTQAVNIVNGTTTTGGDVLLSSGSLINVGSVNTSTTSSGTVPGQIWAIGSGAITTSTQDIAGSPYAAPVWSNPGQTSIGGNANIVFTPSIIGHQTGSISGFSAGGFSSITGSGTISVSIGGNYPDLGLTVPLISTGVFNLGAATIQLYNTNTTSIALLGFSDITIGSSSNPATFTTGGPAKFDISNVCTSDGNVSLNIKTQSNSPTVQLAYAEVNGNFALTSNGGNTYLSSLSTVNGYTFLGSIGGSIFATGSVGINSNSNVNLGDLTIIDARASVNMQMPEIIVGIPTDSEFSFTAYLAGAAVSWQANNAGTGAVELAPVVSGHSVTLELIDPATVTAACQSVKIDSGAKLQVDNGLTVYASSVSGNITGTYNLINNCPSCACPSSTTAGLASTANLGSFLLSALALQNAAQQAQQALVNTQIGTRIATDYTPFSRQLPLMPPGHFPLQGYVAAGELAVSQAQFSGSGFNADELNALANQGILFGAGSKGNFFDLLKGFMLFMPNNNISVQTREGTAYIPKGAKAWVMETGADVAIYDLHDDLHTGPIKVVANKKMMTLSPGRAILLTKNKNAGFEEINPGRAIAYRNVRSADLGSGIKAFVSEFSISHGLGSISILKGLLHSKDPAQRKAAWTMIKNAVILADLTGSAYKLAGEKN